MDFRGVRTVRSANAAEQKLVGPQYRMTFAEQERARRSKKQQKKEEKKKEKEAQKMKSVWNIDNEIRNEDMLHVKWVVLPLCKYSREICWKLQN